MKNTKRHSASASTRRASATATTNAPTSRAITDASVAPSSSTSRAPRRVASANATTKSKSPTLATAARSVRARSTNAPATAPSSQLKPQQKTSTKSAHKTSTSAPKPRPSLVHDAVQRAYHANITGHVAEDDMTECERLRGQLVRVMADHQRQADEIIALRALARSLKEEVESMQEAALHDEATATKNRQRGSASVSPTHREFFRLDAQMDTLREDNEQLRVRIETVEREKCELEDVLDREIPRCELLAVHAQAQLASTTSQLHDEQRENDRLRSEVAYYKAQSRSPVSVHRTTTSKNTRDDKENDRTQANARAACHQERPLESEESLRESLMSSVASLSMSAASTFSCQLQGDVHTLKSELRRLHRSIDASVLSARGGKNRCRQPREEQEDKVEAD